MRANFSIFLIFTATIFFQACGSDSTSQTTYPDAAAIQAEAEKLAADMEARTKEMSKTIEAKVMAEAAAKEKIAELEAKEAAQKKAAARAMSPAPKVHNKWDGFYYNHSSGGTIIAILDGEYYNFEKVFPHSIKMDFRYEFAPELDKDGKIFLTKQISYDRNGKMIKKEYLSGEAKVLTKAGKVTGLYCRSRTFDKIKNMRQWLKAAAFDIPSIRNSVMDNSSLSFEQIDAALDATNFLRKTEITNLPLRREEMKIAEMVKNAAK